MPDSQPLAVQKSESWRMFNDISPRYDFLNRVLSFGLDLHWRKVFARYLPDRPALKILDLATGTADILLIIFQRNPNASEGVGTDLAEKMLEIGRRKIAQKDLSGKIRFETGDAHHISYPDNSFDAVTISFGIRNMTDPTKVLREMHRAAKVGGRALILEFSLPRNPVFRFIHVTYLRYGVPVIGWLLTGHYKAYRYLTESIEDFAYGDAFCRLMTDAGFANVKAHPLLFGIATIYQGEKI